MHILKNQTVYSKSKQDSTVTRLWDIKMKPEISSLNMVSLVCHIKTTLHMYDRVRHDEIIKELTKLKIDRKDLRIIKNMY